MNHFLLINKPPGITSFHVVKRVKEIVGIDKVGHMGTLDKRACGLLIIGLGKGLRLEEYIIKLRKTYIVEIIFGIESETYDRDAKNFSYSNVEINKNIIESILSDFIGDLEQEPPYFSAIHYKGKRSYELARKGVYVNLPKRKITIYDIKLISFKEDIYPKALIEFTVSSGTYIRSLVKEIGKKLNLPTLTSFLLRTKIGKFSINDAILFKNLEREWKDRLIPAIKLLDFPSFYVSSNAIKRVKNGNPITINDVKNFYFCENPIILLNEDGELLAIAHFDKNIIKPDKVFV
jgi:tRNA pseudouridine55 synthase